MRKTAHHLKRILVATDFSEHSQSAVIRAVELANQMKAHLTILHIAKKGFLEKLGNTIPTLGKILITPEEYAKSLLKKQIGKFSKNKIKYDIISGNHPAPKILKYAQDHKFNLLVLGAHGKYSIHDWFVGTTAEYVARKTKVPVLIVKKAPQKPYKKILVPIDFSPTSKNALEFAHLLFPKSDLSLLHVGDHHYEDFLKKDHESSKQKIKEIRKAILFSLEEQTKKFINASGFKSTKLHYDIKLGYPGVVIVEEAKKKNQDLVIMGTKGHSERHYLFIGRVASLTLLEIDRDILLVPPRA